MEQPTSRPRDRATAPEPEDLRVGLLVLFGPRGYGAG